MSINQSNDIQLLLHCLSPTVDAATKVADFNRQEIDWLALIQLAKKHKVGPLFCHRLNELGIDTIPTELHTEFRQYSQTMAGRNIFVTFELIRLLLLLGKNGIDTLPYKGPMLAQTLYKTLNLRIFSDLDIIVQPDDMTAVEDLLMAEGYRPYHGKKTRSELAAHMRSPAEHTYDFYHDKKQVYIEVHWRFWPRTFSSVDPQDIWHRRETGTLAGKEVANLAIEDYLIILCMHGSRHIWQRLSWLCDIAMLLHHYPGLNWSQVMVQAEQWGVQRMLYLGIYLAQAWLNAPLPDVITEQLAADTTLPVLAAQVEQQVFEEGKSSKTFMASTQYQVRVRERWQDKAAYGMSFMGWLLQGCPSTAG